VEAVIAGVSAAIAFFALLVSMRVASRQTAIQAHMAAIQARLAAIEEARRAEEVEARGRARVTADLRHEQPDHRGTDTWLVLQNDGPAVARDVGVTVDQGPQVPVVYELETIELQPGQSRPFRVAVTHRDAPTVLRGAGLLKVLVRWTDKAGTHEKLYTLQAN
jgi:hypothetical protein